MQHSVMAHIFTFTHHDTAALLKFPPTVHPGTTEKCWTCADQKPELVWCESSTVTMCRSRVGLPTQGRPDTKTADTANHK